MENVAVGTWSSEEIGRAREPLDRVQASEAVKRAIDVLVAGLVLAVLAPLLALVALAIRLSGGPVLFRQVRVGCAGRTFSMLKFRTMVDGAHELRGELEALNETSGVFKISCDPRVTRLGRWLRRASVDELPQLLNVLRGEMSLVGPRPLIPQEDALVDGPYRERLSVRPGLTGPWQAMGAVRPPLREMVVMDCLYVETRSLWGDVKIIARTAAHVLRLRGV